MRIPFKKLQKYFPCKKVDEGPISPAAVEKAVDYRNTNMIDIEIVLKHTVYILYCIAVTESSPLQVCLFG